MKPLMITIWFFVHLLIFAMCGYIYLLWSQYWLNNGDNHTYTMPQSYDEQIYLYNRGLLLMNGSKSTSNIAKNRTKHSIKTALNVTHVSGNRPRFPNLQSADNLMNNVKFVCSLNDTKASCRNKTIQFKTKIINELKRVHLDESNVLKSGSVNPYKVDYTGRRDNYVDKSPEQLMCELKATNFRTITRDDLKSARIDKQLVAKKQLFANRGYASCAIVSSAGALLGSNRGRSIDSHDLVIRFNDAPSRGYETDVSRKTTVRILNSQILAKSKFNFTESRLYKNVTLLVWDPGDYQTTKASSLDDWFERLDHDFVATYANFRRTNPKSRVHLVDPRSLWRIWDFLQMNSPIRVRRNPPSSGFLGLVFAMSHCEHVDFFEYVPSVRVTSRCHYYDTRADSSCTFGVWHPLAMEKLLTQHMNVDTDDVDVYQNGFVRIRGFDTVKCGSELMTNRK